MKVFINNPRENWIVDRLRKEWYQINPDNVTEDIDSADIVWILAPWQWQLVPGKYLKEKTVVCTVHHIVPNKFNGKNIHEFLFRDQFVNAYHVPNKHTASIVSQLTKKPVYTISYWFNSELWTPEEKNACREELGLQKDKFIVGSFQRDTEGSDLISPKLEKGPDLFCDYIEKIKDENTLVLLGGWRRQYVISRLENMGVPYEYFELAPIEKIKKMYGACDLYVVSSRHEGGPQALFEAAAMKVPIISTSVGLAEEVLCENCVVDLENIEYLPTLKDVEKNFEKVQEYDILKHRDKYNKMFEEVGRNVT